MELVRRAVIDVGTNSVKLLVADVGKRKVVPVWEGSKQTRLGKGFYRSHELQPGAILQTSQAVSEFAAAARKHKAIAVRIVATSAVRDAANAPQLTNAIKKATGLKVEILSGEQEADLVFQGITTDPALEKQSVLLLDVGGGSTEFILGRQRHKFFSASFPVGSVRLLETFPHSDPPRVEEFRTMRNWVKTFLKKEVHPGLEASMRVQGDGDKSAPSLVGTGGTAAILARMEAHMEGYDRERIESTHLSRERVRWHVRHLWALPLKQREQIVGLPPNRADVILTGALIYEAVMEVFHFQELRVSTRGLRFAAVMG